MTAENKIPPTGVRWPVIKIRLDMDEEQMDKLAEKGYLKPGTETTKRTPLVT